VADGVLEPLELAHMPYRNGGTYEDYVGLRGLDRMGRKKWQKHVEKVVAILKHGLQVDYVMLGGGQTKKLKELPAGVRLGKNANAIDGGLRLWNAPVLKHRHRRPHVSGSRRKRESEKATSAGDGATDADSQASA
jgi:hypothetical protein